MRVMLTGIGGSIGVHMFAYLMQNTDWEVVGVDSFRHKGLVDRVSYFLQTHPDWQKRTTIITYDLTAPLSYMSSKLVGYINGILNFASLTDVADSIKAPGAALYNNSTLMINLLEMWRQSYNPAMFFLHVSSDEVYGPVMCEGDTHTEWSAIIPSSPYAASKGVQEAMAISYWRTYNLPLIIVNIANNFGPMQNPAKFPCLAQRLIAAGKPVPIHVHEKLNGERVDGSRYYLHSWNTADAINFILDRGAPKLHVDGACDLPDRYNITGDRSLTNLALASEIAKILGKPLDVEYKNVHKLRPGHDIHYGLSGAKMEALGWKPRMEFWESVRASVDWYRSNPKWLNPK